MISIMENYNTGDKVRFMNAVGEGIITRVLGKSKLMVLVDGFEIPCFASDILVVNAANAAPAPKPAAVAAPPPVLDQEGDEYEVSIAFLLPKNAETDLYLLNDSPYQLYYSAGFINGQGRITPLSHGHVEADSKLFVKSLNLNEIKEQTTLWVEVLPFKNIEFLPFPVRQATQELSGIDFSQANIFTENDFFDANALIFKLLPADTAASAPPVPEPPSADEVMPPVKLQMPVIVGRLPLPIVAEEVRTIDLRAVVLRSQLGFVSEKELLDIQLERAKAGIEALLQKQCRKCVLMYGLGGGQIKTELQALLEAQYPHLTPQDASLREYHYGAVMIVCNKE